MRKQFLIILVAILSTHCYSQISFEKGYYINNNEQKIECLIKNMDWRNNPTALEYKLSADAASNKLAIKLVKEFGVYNYSKYTRSNVNIDRSSKNLDDLSTIRNPIFKEETLFLKVLIDGKSSLYQYEDESLIRFFYRKDSSQVIEQLVFKIYKTSGDMIGENNMFKQQLLNDFKCQGIKDKEIERISYTKEELVNFFVRYNQCNSSELVNFEEKQKKDLFNLSPRLGINSSSLSIQGAISSSKDVDFGNQVGFRLGIEAELILPFNKNKWSIIIEPTYQYFKSEKIFTTYNTKVDYKSLELPIGLRYYFFLNNNSKIFINTSFILDFASNSTVSYSTGAELEITNSPNLGFGLGYKQNDKYSLELRYHTNRDILSNYAFYSTGYNTLSVIFGYSIF